MVANEFTVRVRKFMKNPLLQRKQFALEVLHPGKAAPTRKEMQQRLCELYSVKMEQTILFGFKVAFGGGRSTGFGLIYDSGLVAKKFEMTFRLKRHDIKVVQKAHIPKRVKKEIKNRRKKVRGIKKAKVTAGKK